MAAEPTLCQECEVGSYPPLERFERVAARPDGPTFLNRCRVCGALWEETLRYANRLSAAEARGSYPDAHL